MDAVIKLRAADGAEWWEVPILYEDAELFALCKPARLLTSPDRYDPARPNLMKLLHADITRGARWVRERGLSYLANVHRLDFETSGVILLARSKPGLIALANQFGNQRAEKVYVALVHGSGQPDAFQVQARLGPHPKRPGLVRVDEKNGKPALTDFSVRERFTRCAFIECRPRTGRTHQIRVHLQKTGFPIVGDALYGGRPLLLSQLKPDYRLKPNKTEKPLLDRVALHAESLTVVHPSEGRAVTIQAPLAKDLRVATRYLRQFSPG